MKIGPKYKIARRLGAPIFEKTQTQKYAISAEKKSKSKGFSRGRTEYGNQLNEKQKARFTYNMSERQFSNYIKEAISKKSVNVSQTIFEFLELRLDNVVYRLGLSQTRSGAKQMVSHGHIKVNNRKVSIPSMRVRVGDKIEINDRSKDKPLFKNFDERFSSVTVPVWLKFEVDKKIGVVMGLPHYLKTENMFDLNTVVELYSRS
ncbi:MAG: 30S ribosomal protein S4 [Minisyncoccia bacterium]